MEISSSIDNTYGNKLTPEEKNEKALFPMIALGVGELLGG